MINLVRFIQIKLLLYLYLILYQVYKQTVGVDFFIRRLNIPPKYQIAMQLWDIGGQSIGSKMITNYISGAHVCTVNTCIQHDTYITIRFDGIYRRCCYVMILLIMKASRI
jgi:hypothetical protein